MPQYKTIALRPEVYEELVRIQAEIIADNARYMPMAEVIRELIRCWRKSHGAD